MTKHSAAQCLATMPPNDVAQQVAAATEPMLQEVDCLNVNRIDFAVEFLVF